MNNIFLAITNSSKVTIIALVKQLIIKYIKKIILGRTDKKIILFGLINILLRNI